MLQSVAEFPVITKPRQRNPPYTANYHGHDQRIQADFGGVIRKMTRRSIEEQDVLHWVVFPIPRPRHGAVGEGGGRDQRIATLEGGAVAISSPGVASAPPALRG